MTPEISIGADPELFLQDRGTGLYYSAHNIVLGTKQQPVSVPGGAVQVDGVAAEFNVDPSTNAEEFVNNIRTVVKHLQNMVTVQRPELFLTASPTVHFKKEYFESLPDFVKQLGCTPDYNAYTGEVTPPPEAKTLFRTGGGHVHVGWNEDLDDHDTGHVHDCLQVTKHLDCALYVPSLLFDSDRDRQGLYGKPGCFRPKSYGVEYRVLSNAWVGDPDLVEWVFHSTMEAMTLCKDDRYKDNWLFLLPNFKGAENAIDWSRKDLLNYHNDLVGWGFPSLPERYLEA